MLQKGGQRLVAAFGLFVLLLASPPGLRAGEDFRARFDLSTASGTATRALLLATAPGPEGSVEQLEVEVEVPGTVELSLPSDRVWQLRSVAEGFWAPDTVLAAEPGASLDRALLLLPTGRLAGKLLSPPTEQKPSSLVARFESPGGASPEIAVSSVECPLSEEFFECELPAGRLDVRLRSPGFISHYLWNVEIQPGETRTSRPLELRRGASVAGWIETAPGIAEDQLRGARIELGPAGAPGGISRRTAEQRKRLLVETEVDARGFFHFTDVSPGVYRLEVHHPVLVGGSIPQLPVKEGSETFLRRPLELREPLRLTVVIDPPVDFQGEPWQVRLDQESLLAGSFEEVAGGASSESGRFEKEGLEPGRYFVNVSDSSGQSLAFEDLTFETDAEVPITIDSVEIEGRITLADDPLEATLYFGGKSGSVRVETSSDEEGRFEALLPRTGTWRIDIQATQPQIARTFRRVAIQEPEDGGSVDLLLELPDTRIRGTVVDETGTPFERAVVSVFELEEGSYNTRLTTEDGGFEFVGVPYGSLLVSARTLAEDRQSDGLVLNLSKSNPGEEAELTLRKVERFTGAVVGRSGEPIVGASVNALAKAAGGGLLNPAYIQGRTGPGGIFELRVPAATRQLDLIVMAPGRALAARSVGRGLDEPVTFVMEDAGGDLVLELPSDAASGGGFVVGHEGVFIDSAFLASWAARLSRPFAPPGEGILVPNLAPGIYTACVAAQEDLQLFLVGGWTPTGDCASGYLGAGGSLRLSFGQQEEGDP